MLSVDCVAWQVFTGYVGRMASVALQCDVGVYQAVGIEWIGCDRLCGVWLSVLLCELSWSVYGCWARVPGCLLFIRDSVRYTVLDMAAWIVCGEGVSGLRTMSVGSAVSGMWLYRIGG